MQVHIKDTGGTIETLTQMHKGRMDNIKDIEAIFNKTDRLLKDEYYFRHIFKKTEKICQAVFYITKDIAHIETAQSARNASIKLIDTVTETLAYSQGDIVHHVDSILIYVLMLESKLGIAAAEGHLRADHHQVFIQEIDTLTRALRSYETTRHTLRTRTASKKVASSQNLSEEKRESVSNRSAKILRILKDMDSASLRDIAQEFTGVSNKTVQRELMSLIEQGMVRKEGDKRWARYSLV